MISMQQQVKVHHLCVEKHIILLFNCIYKSDIYVLQQTNSQSWHRGSWKLPRCWMPVRRPAGGAHDSKSSPRLRLQGVARKSQSSKWLREWILWPQSRRLHQWTDKWMRCPNKRKGHYVQTSELTQDPMRQKNLSVLPWKTGPF